MMNATYPVSRVPWVIIDKDKEQRYDKFLTYAASSVEQLFNLTPIEIAAAVPFIEIRQANGGTLLSNQFFKPPEFGKSMDKRFGERPDVSIETITVKTQNPRGWILYRELDISIIVHRPDAVFDSSINAVMRSLLDFRNSHTLTYGWTGGNSMLSNGASPQDSSPISNSSKVSNSKTSNTATDYPSEILGDPEPPSMNDLYAALKQIRFRVINYDFNITVDNQVHFQIRAIEDGELATRDAVIFNNRYIDGMFKTTKWTMYQSSQALSEITAIFNDQLRQIPLYPIEFTEDKIEKGKKVGEIKNKVEFVELGDVFNVLFSDPLSYAVSSLGYKTLHLQFARFNNNCPPVKKEYGGKGDVPSSPSDIQTPVNVPGHAEYTAEDKEADRVVFSEYKGISIGKFKIRLSTIKKILNDALAAKSQITVYGIMQQIFGVISNDPWMITSADSKKVKQPEIVLRTAYNPKTGHAVFQVLDRLHYTDIESRKPPTLSFGRSLSFFKDLKFEVINDEQMKSIFMQRQISRSRSDTTAIDRQEIETREGLPQFAMMYRSAIKGSITMLGNFAFDVFGVIKLDFGIPIWDGYFYVLNKTDTISKDGFFSTIVLQAEGSNPLGKNVKQGTDLLPPWVTAGGARTAEDWVKQRLLVGAFVNWVDTGVEQQAPPLANFAAPAANFQYKPSQGTNQSFADPFSNLLSNTKK